MSEALERFRAQHLTTVSPDRRTAHLTLLWDLQDWLAPTPLATADVEAVDGFLADRVEDGYSPGTLRKWRGMLLAFYTWGWREGFVSGDTLLRLRAIRLNGGSHGRTRPRPYRPRELSKLWASLDERWRRLPEDEAWYWLSRWRDGRSPYARVRAHAIRCQLDAIIALALHCGLRRSEIFRLNEEDMHDDNAYVLVWDDVGRWDGECRHVPYTEAARTLVAPWCRVREAIAPEHARAWLNLHACTTMREPMSRDTFNKLLRTYIGPGWTLARLRSTCGVAWAKAGLSPEHLRQVFGYSSLNDVLPYLALVGGDVERQMNRRDTTFHDHLGLPA